jgi:hypothetical protein
MRRREMRKIAIGAVRSEIRRRDLGPVLQASDAFRILDDLWRQERDLVASQWYITCSDTEYRSFCREWTRVVSAE